MQPIPISLTPFFQEYDIKKLTPENDSHTIIERVLQFGNRAELHWLFTVYTQAEISSWVRQHGRDKLPQPHRRFWQIILGINE
jgi:hypothetical protein